MDFQMQEKQIKNMRKDTLIPHDIQARERVIAKKSNNITFSILLFSLKIISSIISFCIKSFLRLIVWICRSTISFAVALPVFLFLLFKVANFCGNKYKTVNKIVSNTVFSNNNVIFFNMNDPEENGYFPYFLSIILDIFSLCSKLEDRLSTPVGVEQNFC